MYKWYLLINSNFNDSAQLYFAAGIYCLHGKFTAVWNFNLVKLTEVKFAPKWVSLRPGHVNADKEVTSHRSDILPQSQISNRFEFTSGLM